MHAQDVSEAHGVHTRFMGTGDSLRERAIEEGQRRGQPTDLVEEVLRSRGRHRTGPLSSVVPGGFAELWPLESRGATSAGCAGFPSPWLAHHAA